MGILTEFVGVEDVALPLAVPGVVGEFHRIDRVDLETQHLEEQKQIYKNHVVFEVIVSVRLTGRWHSCSPRNRLQRGSEWRELGDTNSMKPLLQ